MLASIEKLKKSREHRLNQKIPILSIDEKNQLLKEFHPDYRPGVHRELKVGINKGDMAVVELANLLEARSKVDPETVDLTRIELEVDTLVIGAGGAGLTAAIFSRDGGASVALATKLRLGDSNTTMAEGGINAAISPGDSPTIHYLDTMGGGNFTNIPELVRALATDSPFVVKWLEELGVPFDRDPDSDLPLPLLAGGHSRPRVCSVGDFTGMSIIQVLRAEVEKRDIRIMEFSAVVDLLLDDKGQCAGAVLLDLLTKIPHVVKAKTVILATGGIGRLHIQGFPTTNHYGATADGLVVAYRAGARLGYLDSIQFHPTGTAYPDQLLGLLVTEVARSRGAHLVDVDGERFVNELQTRDLVASANVRQIIGRKKGIMTPSGMQGVWLDTPLIDTLHGEGTVQKSYTHLYHRFKRYGIDFAKDPILIYPAQHYQNGGIITDDMGRSNVPNLYAAGEVAGGVHGRNRLGGNSLSDLFVFGRRAGIDAAQRVPHITAGRLSLSHVCEYAQGLEAGGLLRDMTSPLLLPDYLFEKAFPKFNQ
jgi:succinate dehydrogenase / fumarate reductase flavoprotein subunit